MTEIPKAYEPQSVEDKWYQFWLDNSCFTADPARVSEKRPAFSIVIPPPNVTGMLHMGHVLNNTIQDILSRKARMDGKEVLWLPGTDHAGIATQVQVEKALKKEERKTKYDLGREEFLKRVWTWKEKHGGIIINQLKKLGCSCDWTRERFTMDPEYSRCVQKVFVELYKKGLIYRGKRMVNWCPVSQTALSDEEVEMKPQKGFMYHFKVEVAEFAGSAPAPGAGASAPAGGSGRPNIPSVSSIPTAPDAADEASAAAREARALPGPDGKIWLTIATTRPETIPGDTAVAVNPKDPRYAHLIGKHVIRPLPIQLPPEQKLIPIIGDEHVDFEFGTGVLKVTPAHDKADFEIGARHKLPIVDIMNANGTMNDLAGEGLAGLDRFEARKVAVERLKELAVMVEEKPYENNVGFSQRADVPIEPRLSEQWFLKYPSVEQAKACVANSRTVRIVVLRGDELPGATRSEFRHSAIKLAREKGWLGRSFPNQDTGWQIHVRRRSLSHAFSGRNDAAIQAVAALPELIQTAVLVRSEPHVPPAPDFKAVHHFMAALRIGEQDFAIPVMVKELANGQYLYDHKAKKITPGGKPLGPHPLAEKLGIQPAPGACWKLVDLISIVNGQPEPCMEFYPQRWAKVYDHWLTNIQDWCISRQLWWGHQIPVWYNTEARTKASKPIAIVELTGNELNGSNIKELRDAAWEFADKHALLNHSFWNAETGWNIVVRPASLEHAFTHLGAANIKAVVVLPELIRTAIKLGTLHHMPQNKNFKAVHLFVAAARIGDELYQVKITVKEHLDGQKLYDHQLFKRSTPDGKSPTPAALASKLTRPTSGAQIPIADLIPNVNADPGFTRCQIEEPGPNWIQDPDVLDTWFSSWLWPFATMGWTGDKSHDSNTPTLRVFYPTTDLVTGPDIIFFWVARMIMAGYEYMGDLPFKNVYFTGIIRDKQGRKMSKTLGNSPDPLVLIAQYGADALRFGTMRSAPLGQDVLFDEKDVELGRNFCNKLWNACRFRQIVGTKDEGRSMKDETGTADPSTFNLQPSTFPIQGEINPSLLTSDDKWILLKLNDAIREVSTALAEYKFSEATAALYRFFWNEYCDWYVEASKAVFGRGPVKELNELNQLQGETSATATDSPIHSLNDLTSSARKANTLAVIDFVLSHTLRMFHPFLPFITEELWHGMGYSTDMPPDQGGKTIMNAPWPKPFDSDFRDFYALDDCYLEFANNKYEVVTQGRNLRRVGNIQAGKRVKFVLKPLNEVLPHDAEVIKILLNAEALEITPDYAAKKGTPAAHTPLGELFLPLDGLVDVEAEKVRLTKKAEEYQTEITKVEQKLANPNFTQKVPPQVLVEHQQRLADWQTKLTQVKASLDGLGS